MKTFTLYNTALLTLVLLIAIPAVQSNEIKPLPFDSATKIAQPSCADPATDIQIQLLNKTGATQGRVRITGSIRNIGNLPWVNTRYGHRLNAVLAIKISEQYYDGQPVGYPRDLSVLGIGEQQTIVYEMNYTARYNAQYPKFVMRFSEGGTPDYNRTPREKLDCRSDNNRKEIGAAEINALFGNIPPPPPALSVLNSQFGNGKATVSLRFHREDSGNSKITAQIEPPHNGNAPEVMVQGNTGTATVVLSFSCPPHSPANAEQVKVLYRLSGYLGLGQLGSSWVPLGDASQSLSYNLICKPSASGPTLQVKPADTQGKDSPAPIIKQMNPSSK